MSISSRSGDSNSEFVRDHATTYYYYRTVRNSLDQIRYTDMLAFVAVTALVQFAQPWVTFGGVGLFVVGAIIKVRHSRYRFEAKYICKTAFSPEEASALIIEGYDYVTTFDKGQLFRKRTTALDERGQPIEQNTNRTGS